VKREYKAKHKANNMAQPDGSTMMEDTNTSLNLHKKQVIKVAVK
jgi:hypothetical protein